MTSDSFRDVSVREIYSDHPAMPQTVAQVGQRQRTATTVVADFNDHIRPRLINNLLVHPEVSRTLQRLDAEVGRLIHDPALDDRDKLLQRQSQRFFQIS